MRQKTIANINSGYPFPYIHTIFIGSKEDPTFFFDIFYLEKSGNSDTKDKVPDTFPLSDDKKYRNDEKAFLIY